MMMSWGAAAGGGAQDSARGGRSGAQLLLRGTQLRACGNESENTHASNPPLRFSVNIT